eukprot:SAG11_NODE_3456_length_2437_cov_462.117622_3_plen_119_part_00
MAFGDFLGQVAKGQGMNALKREGKRLGVANKLRTVKTGLRIGSQVGKMFGVDTSGLDSGLDTLNKVQGQVESVGSTLQAVEKGVKNKDILGTAMAAKDLMRQGQDLKAEYGTNLGFKP